MLKKSTFLVLIALMFVVPSVYSQSTRARNALRGMNIVVGNWWENYDTNTYVPQNDVDEQVLQWRKNIQREYGFTMSMKNIAGWGEMAQVATTSIMAGRPAANVFVLEPRWANALKAQNLIYPVSDNREVNFQRPAAVRGSRMAVPWNPNTYTNFLYSGKSYAFSIGANLSNTQVVFFNKRLFREAGLDPNLPYDLQKNGQWTWDRFLQICRQLTRDTNNDGIMDTYALPRDLSTEILAAILSSNGAQYVTRDSRTGRYANATGTPAFLEALNFTIRLNNEGIMKPRPEGTNWDWFKAEFADGKVAMRIDESYVWGELGNMRDDWGMVLPPKGPRVDNYRVFTRENVMVIPSTFNRDQVDAIMLAVWLWYTPVTDRWQDSYYNVFRDTRAVDETLALIRDLRLHMNKNYTVIPGLSAGGIAWEMWYHEGDPAQLIEKVRPAWDALIQDANGL